MDDVLAITQGLAKLGPEALSPVLDTLADPQGSQLSKIVSAMSIKQIGTFSPVMIDRLVQMAKPENEFTTRACAVDLLGGITDPRVDVALNEYKNDPDRRVRFYATYGLAKRSPEGCKALTDLWKAPDTTAQERNDIVAQLANIPKLASQGSVLEILHSAIQDPAIEENLRLASITALGQIGTSESLASLAVCAEKDPSENVRKAAKSTSGAIAAQPAAPAAPAVSPSAAPAAPNPGS